jgi:signal transduction histidine kinase/ActR/RegA family two-component response regulator
MRLRSHLLLLTLGTLAPMVAFAIVAAVIAVQRENAVFRRGATERTLALLTAVDTELAGHVTSLRALASSPALERADLRAFHHEAARALATQPHWRRIVLAEPSGAGVLDAGLAYGAAIPPLADRSSLDEALRTGRHAIGSLIVDGGDPVFGVSIPIVDEVQPRYVLIAYVDPAAIVALLTPQRLPPDWVGVVLDPNRRIVARTKDPKRTIGQLASESIRAALDRAPEGWFHGTTLEGLDVYTPYNRSGTTGWTVAMGIPAPVVEAGVSRMVQVLLLGVLAAIASAIILAAALGRRITAPIGSLASVARSLEHGVPVEAPPRAGVAEVREVSHTLVQAARAAREREEALRAADRAKDEFLAMLGHELRNPLGALASAVELLQLSGEKEEPARTAQEVIVRQVRHMTRLVDDLLEVSRVTNGKVNLSLQPLDLAQAVQDVVGDMRSGDRLGEHDVRVHASAVWIRADAARIDQVVANLVGNALKYTPEGGRIDIEVARRDGDAQLTVTDTGIGMSPELCARVFDLFVQGERALDRSLGGLGIGLTLVKGLVELQGGSVNAASDGPGHGSCFVVRLPAVRPPRPTEGDAETPDVRPARRRILVVEDHEDVRQSLRAALELFGHEVFEAADGRAGVETAARVHPAVAVVDIGLPALDGYEVARQLRALPGGDSMLLVALTGYGQRESRSRALDAGFDEYLTKPVSPGDLAQRIESALARPGAGV